MYFKNSLAEKHAVLQEADGVLEKLKKSNDILKGMTVICSMCKLQFAPSEAPVNNKQSLYKV